MAHLVPGANEINSLPQNLTEGERALMEALRATLNDSWTIYVQPYLNGIRPDIIIFSESAGIGIFEVKDWHLGAYEIAVTDDDYVWRVRDPESGALKEIECPLRQVQRYRHSLYKYEIPALDSQAMLDKSVYSLVSVFVYFHHHKGKDARAKLAPILRDYDTVFGSDELAPRRLREMLNARGLRTRPRVAEWMARDGLAERIRNALSFPDHGQTALPNLLVKFTPKQRALLPNSEGRRRVLGVAGSGKTIIIAHKAAAAAREGKNVLVVCYNITMANYLKDLTRRLARHYGPHVHRRIQIGHYHRWFPHNLPHPKSLSIHGEGLQDELTPPRHSMESDQRKSPWEGHGGEVWDTNFIAADDDDATQPATPIDPNIDGDVGATRRVAPTDTHNVSPWREIVQPVDVLLVDEGQDFERQWIENLLNVCQPAHFMFMEDDRQDIYARTTARGDHLPGISGRPYLLNESFRIPREIARLGDEFIGWAKIQSESGAITTEKEVAGGLFTWNYWYNGAPERCLLALRHDLADLIATGELRAPADTAILVCNVHDGWAVCDALETIGLPVQANFESRAEHAALMQLYQGESFAAALREMRRGYKAGFWMQGGRIKVCTVHSFKGWELSRILVYFHPEIGQQNAKHQLLYTAMTRSQGYLTVYNGDPALDDFGRTAVARGLMKARFERAARG